MQRFCGYIALLGRPNAGKSTLLNAVVGQKIVGVSKRPQTTRNRIAGVVTLGERQLVFLDTPGMHNSGGQPKINHLMNRTAWASAAEADVICYLLDVKRSWQAEDSLYLKRILTSCPAPVLVIASKGDSIKKAEAVEALASMREAIAVVAAEAQAEGARGRLLQEEAYLTSAKRPDEVTALRDKLAALLPESPWLFAEDDLTDKSERFIVGELIREQVFRKLGKELPYGVSVIVDALSEGAKRVSIKATIITNKASHKPMIIGARGQCIKEIGTEARLSLETHFTKPVFLELYVKVSEKWVDDLSLISEFQALDDKDS